MKTKLEKEISNSTENFTKEIEKRGITLFDHYYNYVDPDSDTGRFRKLQELNKKANRSYLTNDYQIRRS